MRTILCVLSWFVLGCRRVMVVLATVAAVYRSNVVLYFACFGLRSMLLHDVTIRVAVTTVLSRHVTRLIRYTYKGPCVCISICTCM